MKRLLILLLMFILLLGTVQAEMMALMPDLTNPSMIAVKGDKLYVVEDALIYVFSMETFKLVNTFGKKGNGPGEFSPNPSFDMHLKVKVLPDRLFLTTPQKFAFFDLSGNLQIEKRYPFFSTQSEPCKEKIVFQKYFQKEKSVSFGVIIMDSDLNQLAVLEELGYPYKAGEFEPIREYLGFRVYEGKIYVLNGKRDLSFAVYNHEGDKISSIDRPFSRTKLNEKHKKLTWEWLKRKNWFKMIPPEYKKKTVFPSVLPICKDFFIDNKQIYIHTFVSDEAGAEFLVIPIENPGTMKTSLSVTNINLFESLPYAITNQKFYHLKEDQNEAWELHVEDIILENL